jgi:hypothetical protein
MKNNLKQIWELLAGAYRKRKQQNWTKSVKNLP